MTVISMLMQTSDFFLYFIPAAIIIHALLFFSKRAQNIWLFLASLVFYGWGSPGFVLVLLVGVFLHMMLGMLIEKNRETQKRAKALLLIGIASQVMVLAIVYYFSPSLPFISGLFSSTSLNLLYILPLLGLVFYVLRSISYIADVYKGEIVAERSFIRLGLYYSFFPLSLCHVMRYDEFEGQIDNRRLTLQDFSSGLCRFVLGAVKVFILADTLGVVVNHIVNLSSMSADFTNVPVLMAWLGAIALSLQFYYILSGFADMAAGFGKMFGFQLSENFNYPFAASSITGLWKRWHITMIDWFHKYIGRTLDNAFPSHFLTNILALWLVVGLWHGLGFRFLLWGFWNFIFIVIEKTFSSTGRKLPTALGCVYVFTTVAIGFIMIRTADMFQVFLYIRNMLGLNSNGFICPVTLMFLREYFIILLVAVLFVTPVFRICRDKFNKRAFEFLQGTFALSFVLMFLLLVGINIVGDVYFVNNRLRANLTEAYGHLHTALGKDAQRNFQIVRSRTGQLNYGSFYQFVPFEILSEHARRMWSMNRFFEDNGTRLLFVNPPPVFQRGLPNDFAPGLPTHNLNPVQDAFLFYLRSLGVNYVDLRYTFADNLLPAERYIFQTDHNWTTEASFEGFRDTVAGLNAIFGSSFDPEGRYRDIENYYKSTFPDSFLGSFGQRTGASFSGFDDFTLIWPGFDTDITFEYVSSNTINMRTGDFAHALINSAYLPANGSSNPARMYASYLGGLRPWSKIVNNNSPDAPRLLMIHDSFGLPLAAFLAPLFREIHMIWPAGIRDFTIEDYLYQNQFDYVIVIINSVNLSNSAMFDFFADLHVRIGDNVE